MNPKDKLTENFAFKEFFTRGLKFDEPLWHEWLLLPVKQRDSYTKNIIAIANRLQVLRDIIDDPIRITSGWRSEAVNEAVGGAVDSTHLKGQAVDVEIPLDKRPLLQLSNWSGGYHAYTTWYHLDVSKKRRW